ncbi:hypothetical protein IW138_006522 [Coemansia sp. RSA 986]|nr:hypothetical protein IW138_006522 [Coemansia sp. RSA 986]
MFGGFYNAEALYESVLELKKTYVVCKNDTVFWKELYSFYPYVGRLTLMHFAEHLTEKCGGAKIYLKREDLCHTSNHNINNVVGQIIIAKRLGKLRIIAESGAGQHGVATAAICAKLDLECIIYMGFQDMRRQSLNIFRIRALGGKVIPVTEGSCTLKDAINEAMRDLVSNLDTTIPSLACAGGGSNAIGMFHPFIKNKSVRLVGAEAEGDGVDTSRNSATISARAPGVFHGAKTYLLQDKKDQVMETHSIAAGLNYPGVGPENSWLKPTGRVEHHAVTDAQALEGFRSLAELEGIIPSLEASHAVYQAMQFASAMTSDELLVICISGNGDKDLDTIAEVLPAIGPQIG